MSSPGYHDPSLGPAHLVEVAERVFAYVKPDGSWHINTPFLLMGSMTALSRC